MAFNPYLRWSITDLLAKERQLSSQYEKWMISVGAGDTNTSKTPTGIGIQQALEKVRYALFVADPGTYPITDATSVDRTRASFWSY